MSRAPFLVAGSVAAAGLLWAVKLILTPGLLAPDAGVLAGLDLLLLSTVAAAGLVLARGRWSRRLAYGVLAAGGAAALGTPLDAWWALALVVSGAALVGLLGPWLNGWLRRLRAAAGPPVPAVLLALSLLALPGAVAVIGHGGLAPGSWLLAAAGPVLAWSYVRAHTAGLWGSRLLPVFALPAALSAPLLPAVLLLLAAAVPAGLAWTAQAGLAVSPLDPRSATVVPMPPELVPPEVLEAAGLDDRGRPR